MKKRYIVFTILVLLICLTGCGKKKVGVNQNSNISSVEKATEKVTKKEIKEKLKKPTKSKRENETNSYQQFYADVEKGILYGNNKGQVTDEFGIPLSEYSYLKITDNGYISNGEFCLEGYGMGNSGKIINLFVRSGESENDDDWTGVYKNTSLKGSGEEIVIVQDGNTATYEFEDTKEINCRIDGTSLSGTLWYFGKNPDGTLNVTSGSGESWGRFEKINNYAKIDVTDYENVIDASGAN